MFSFRVWFSIVSDCCCKDNKIKPITTIAPLNASGVVCRIAVAKIIK